VYADSNIDYIEQDFLSEAECSNSLLMTRCVHFLNLLISGQNLSLDDIFFVSKYGLDFCGREVCGKFHPFNCTL